MSKINMQKSTANVLIAAVFTLNTAVAAPGSKSLTDQILATLIVQHAPQKLYERGNNEWPGGNYSLQVLKAGKPTITSAANTIQVHLPLTIVIAGFVSSDLLNIQLQCDSRFNTTAEITLSPKVAGQVSPLVSRIELAIPPVAANCGATTLAIESFVRALVQQNIPQWQLQLDQKINHWLTGAKN